MLNISKERVHSFIAGTKFEALELAENKQTSRLLLKLLGGFFGLFLIFLFIPWTQNFNANGLVTTLKPSQRPQAVTSAIGGMVEQWYVQEGDYIAKGDTLLRVSEIKDDYFDPNLMERTGSQVKSKEMSLESYTSKVAALTNQINSLKESSRLKLRQTKNKLAQARLKVTSDSIEWEAAKTGLSIAQLQYDRIEGLYDSGLKSLTEFESKKLSFQKAQADAISKENKLLTAKNEVLNAKMEYNAVEQDFTNKIAKAESDKFSTLSGQFEAEASLSKLQNQFSNYEARQGLYVVRAPQDGYVTKTQVSGIGEIIKEGQEILSIMPADYDLAVEMYVEPIDLPLIQKGEIVRIQFDGWPAIVFSGWPNTSYGTFGGEVFAIDNFISPNGKYRVLVAPDKSDHKWPEALRIGAGTYNMVLLKDVPIWYELWRRINGFPPDFYGAVEEKPKSNTKKETKK